MGKRTVDCASARGIILAAKCSDRDSWISLESMPCFLRSSSCNCRFMSDDGSTIVSIKTSCDTDHACTSLYYLYRIVPNANRTDVTLFLRRHICKPRKSKNQYFMSGMALRFHFTSIPLAWSSFTAGSKLIKSPLLRWLWLGTEFASRSTPWAEAPLRTRWPPPRPASS